MHERALMRSVLARVEAVAAAEGAARVTRVSVRLGALSHFTPGHFRDHFEDAAQGTVAEGAAVDAVACADPYDPLAADVVIESVEVELPEGART
jgi:hydrogenase nickel incorporation protein HypA/HybF